MLSIVFLFDCSSVYPGTASGGYCSSAPPALCIFVVGLLTRGVTRAIVIIPLRGIGQGARSREQGARSREQGAGGNVNWLTC